MSHPFNPLQQEQTLPGGDAHLKRIGRWEEWYRRSRPGRGRHGRGIPRIDGSDAIPERHILMIGQLDIGIREQRASERLGMVATRPSVSHQQVERGFANMVPFTEAIHS